MKSLDALGREYGTDKASHRHDFLRKYERYLRPLSEKAAKVLEIGVFQGASLKVWREFFPHATIIGCDINQQRKEYADDRILIEIGDCGKTAFLEQIAETHGPFDVIIDDGSHRWDHQQVAFSSLFEALRPGGVFIIEDIHTSYHERYGAPDMITTVEWLKGAVDMVVPEGEFARLPKRSGYVTRQWRQEVDELVFIREGCIVTRVPDVGDKDPDAKV